VNDHPVAWTIREGHEWEDFSQRVHSELRMDNFSASFSGKAWTENSEPPLRNQTVSVSPRLRAGNPKGKLRPETWPDIAIPLSHITNPAHEWTIHAKLSPNQIGTNDRVLDVLEEV
jgi:hypothetical protein